MPSRVYPCKKRKRFQDVVPGHQEWSGPVGVTVAGAGRVVVTAGGKYSRAHPAGDGGFVVAEFYGVFALEHARLFAAALPRPEDETEGDDDGE